MEHIEQFIKYLTYERRYSKHTVISYRNDLNQYCTYINAHLSIKDLTTADHTHVRSWIVYLMRDGYTAKTVNRKISSVKSFYKFLKKSGSMSANPTSKVTGPKVGKRLPKIIKEDELDKLIGDEEYSDDHGTLRDRLIVDLLYTTGMRRSELIGLKEQDVNCDQSMIKVLGKGNKERLIPISSSMVAQIRKYTSLKREHFDNELSDSLFCTDKGKSLYPKFVYNIVVGYISTVSTSDHKSPHVLRHSFATHMANSGADLNSIKELLGHASLASTEVYMHNTVERLKHVYRSAHPKSGKNN